jgi:hypothetical protein
MEIYSCAAFPHGLRDRYTAAKLPVQWRILVTEYFYREAKTMVEIATQERNETRFSGGS